MNDNPPATPCVYRYLTPDRGGDSQRVETSCGVLKWIDTTRVDNPTVCPKCGRPIVWSHEEDFEIRNQLSAALGWPGGLSADIKPLGELLGMVAALRIAADHQRVRISTALLRDAEQMFGWTEGETARQFPRTAVLLDLDSSKDI